MKYYHADAYRVVCLLTVTHNLLDDPFYGDLKLKNISYQVTLRSFEVWKEKLQKPSKVAIELNKCLQQAVYNDFIPKNPVKLDGLRLWEKKEERKRDNAQGDMLFYTSDEIDLFIQKLKTTDDISKISIFLVFVNLGLRKGELLALQWQDIDLQNKKILIHQAIRADESNKPYIKDTKRVFAISKEILKTNPFIYTFIIKKAWQKPY